MPVVITIFITPGQQQFQQQIQMSAQQLEKFRQETEYVCLKLALKDWNTFLAELRQGNIIRKPPNPTNTPTTTDPLNQLLNQLLTNNQNTQPHLKKCCQCESSVCLEQPIQKVQGGTSVSSSRCSSSPSGEKGSDPFEDYKIQQLWGQGPTMNQQTLQDILRTIDKSQDSFTGFETFRKNNNLDESLVETAKKKCQCQSHLPRVVQEDWIKMSMEGYQSSVKELVLALENTKLRRQLRNLEERVHLNR